VGRARRARGRDDPGRAAAAARRGALTLDIISDTFDTRALDPADRRGPVGIALLGVRLERASPSTVDAPGIDGFRSRLEADTGTLPVRIARSAQAAFTLAMTNVGTRRWPSLREHGIDGAVQVGLRWYIKGSDAAPVADNRVPLALTLQPAEWARMRMAVVPVGLDGARLAPGDYTVRVGLVREKQAWFADGGDALIAFDVTVVP
jgi:hypothetical protein